MKSSVPLAKINNEKHAYWPHWFSLNNYDCLGKLTTEEFIYELEWRLTMLKGFLPSQKTMMIDDHSLKRIRLGDIILRPNHHVKTDFPSVTLLNHVDIAVMNEEIKLEHKDDYLFKEAIYHLPITNRDKRIILAVDINNTDDEYILGSVKSLLNQMRDQLSIAKAKDLPKVKAGTTLTQKSHMLTFIKCLEYKLIPFLDLSLHAQSSFNKSSDTFDLLYTQTALSKLLFNEDNISDKMKKTIIPFYRSIIENDEFLGHLILNIRHDSWASTTTLEKIQEYKRNTIRTPLL